jgi:ApbE superfamily uncharacterized protein (UPF0280 family)
MLTGIMGLHQERTYRAWVHSFGLVGFRVRVAESDLFILADSDTSRQAEDLLREVRADLEAYILRDEGFMTTRRPHQVLHDAPLIARRMASAAREYQVGPMAAVAGAIAESVGEQLAESHAQLIVENGGDIFVRSARPLVFTLYAGEASPFNGKLRFTVPGTPETLGICTSSGTVGHSYSQGRADAVCVIAHTAPLADAAATALGNLVGCQADIDRVLDAAAHDENVLGVVACMGSRLGIWGAVEVV